MAKKGFIKDLNNIEMLPITRGELVLDSSGKQALRSNEFLATDSLPGLMSKEDKAKLDKLTENGAAIDLVSATTDGLAPKIGTAAASTVTTQADEWVLTSTKGATPTWRKLPTNAFLNYYRPILVNGTSLLGNDNTALNIVAGNNINLTTDAGKVTINNSLTKLSLLTDDILSGKYLPLSGGTLTGNLTIGSKSNQAFNYLLLSRLNRGVRINNTDGNAYISFGTLTDANGLTLEKVLTFGDSGLRYSPDASTYYNILHGLNTYIQNGIITINGASITPITSHQSLSNYVTLDTDLTITGSKTFSSVINVTGGNLFREGLRIHHYYNLSSVWFGAVNDIGYDPGMWGISVDSTGMRFRGPESTTGTYAYDYINIIHGGNVGIGVLSPTLKLHVNGTVKATSYVGTNIRIECDKDGILGNKYNEINNYTNTLDLNYSSSTTMSLCVGGGNVGIGTRTPSSKLDILGTLKCNQFIDIRDLDNTKNRLTFQIASGVGRLYTYSDDDSTFRTLYLGRNDTKAIVVTGDGKVGIGTVTPTQKLEVNGNVKATTFLGNLDWSYITNKPTSFTPAAHSHNELIYNKDLRNENTIPNDYNQTFKFVGIKDTNAIGLASLKAGYVSLIGWRGYTNDGTGPLSWELASGDSRMYVRSGNTDTWTYNWKTLAYTTDTYPTKQITALTGYAKATSASDLVTTDTLNIALGKLEYKAGIAYSWYRTITEDDTDEIINKWDEVVDFVNNLEVDLTDEFVTRKTNLTITGIKTFQIHSLSSSTTIKLGDILTDANTYGGWARGIYFNNTSGNTTVSSVFGVYGLGIGSDGSKTNSINYLYLAHQNLDWTTATFKVYGNKATINDLEVYHKGNLKKLSDLTDDIVSGKYLPLTGGTLKNSTVKDILTLDTDSTSEVGIKIKMSGTEKGWIGYHNTYGVYLYNKARQKYLNYKDNGTLLFEGKDVLHGGNYTSYINSTNFPGLAGVRSVTINNDYLRVNTNGTNADLTIPYATRAGYLKQHGKDAKAIGGLPYYDFETLNSEFGTSGADSSTFYLNLVKKLIKTHSTESGIPLFGTARPNSLHITLFRAYTLSNYNNTGLPLYCVGLSIDLGRAYLWGTVNGVWSYDKLAFTSEVDALKDYYWANVKISSTSSTTTTPTFGHTVKLNNNNGGDVCLEFWRTVNASWRILNTGGVLKFQSNYTSSAGSYFDCLSINYNSGSTWIKGYTTSSGFIKSDSSDSYLLLGGGGHKAISDFLLESELATQELSANLTTITKSLTVTADWMDTGIKYTDLPTNGTYVVQVQISGSDNSTGKMYYCYWSGIMSWYRDTTNDDDSDEILLHRSGHAYENTIYLRTITTNRSDGRHLRLLIAANKNLGAAYTYTFKFKRII